MSGPSLAIGDVIRLTPGTGHCRGRWRCRRPGGVATAAHAWWRWIPRGGGGGGPARRRGLLHTNDSVRAPRAAAAEQSCCGRVGARPSPGEDSPSWRRVFTSAASSSSSSRGLVSMATPRQVLRLWSLRPPQPTELVGLVRPLPVALGGGTEQTGNATLTLHQQSG